MYGRQPQLPIDITLGLTPISVATLMSTKYIQKLREHIRLAHKKAYLFQQKEAWHHKPNYDKHSRAVALRTGDTVLVCVTTFKGQHKIQNRWENRKYVVEHQPYPNLPVYVVIPWTGKATARPCIEITCYHQKYLEQAEEENLVEGGEPVDQPTPVPQEHNELPADA